MSSRLDSISKKLKRLSLSNHECEATTQHQNENVSARSKEVFDDGRTSISSEGHIPHNNVAKQNMTDAGRRVTSEESIKRTVPRPHTKAAISPQDGSPLVSMPKKPLLEQTAEYNPDPLDDDQTQASHFLRHKVGQHSLNEADVDNKAPPGVTRHHVSSTVSANTERLNHRSHEAARNPTHFSGNHTTDTVEHTHTAPAVTHETIQPVVHQVRAEKITRDIHTTDVHHRILPIVDIEYLPARHFVYSSDGQLIEVPESAVEEHLGLR